MNDNPAFLRQGCGCQVVRSVEFVMVVSLPTSESLTNDLHATSCVEADRSPQHHPLQAEGGARGVGVVGVRVPGVWCMGGYGPLQGFG